MDTHIANSGQTQLLNFPAQKDIALTPAIWLALGVVSYNHTLLAKAPPRIQASPPSPTQPGFRVVAECRHQNHAHSARAAARLRHPARQRSHAEISSARIPRPRVQIGESTGRLKAAKGTGHPT